MMKSRNYCGLSSLLGFVAFGTACGPDGGGGRPEESVNPEGRAVICTGAYVNQVTGQRIDFPCDVNEATGECMAIPEAEHAGLSCTTDETADGKAVLPGFENSEDLTHGYCACKDVTAPEDQQTGSCASVCDQVVLDSMNFNAGDPNGPWRCENVRSSANGEKPTLECVHGSIVYFNGGPSDYTMQLVGTQTSTGTFDYGLGTVSSSGSGDVDGILRFSVGDRSLGCASGCPLEVTELGMILQPFSVPGIDLVVFSWGGLSMGTSSVVNQGVLYGRVFDDGSFELDAGFGALVVDYRGDRSGKFAKVLDRRLTGTINFANNSMTLDQVTLSAGEGRVRVNSLSGGAVETPPTPVIATPAVHECASLDATPVQLDASGTSDLEGGPLRYVWSVDEATAGRDAVVDVELALGVHEVKLTAADNTLGRASTHLSLEVVDTTPPVWGPVEMADLTTCDAQVDRHALVVPDVTDGCTGVSDIEAWLVEADGVSLLTPVLLDIEDAVLPKGQSTVRWVARDGAGNEAEVYQTMRVGPAIIASSHLDLRDRIRVLNASGAEGAVASVGEQRSTLGVQSRVAEMLSFGPIFLQNNAVVTGRAASRGAIDLQHGAFAGVLEPNSAVDLGVIPWLAPVSGATFDGADVTVPPDSTLVLASAENGRVQVMSRSRLVIDLDEVRLRELWIEPDATVELRAASPRLIVRDRVVDRGSIVGAGAGQHAELFVLGTEARFERPVQGLSLVAPNARVTVATMAHGSRMGLLVGDVVEVQPDVTLWCDRGSSLTTE